MMKKFFLTLCLAFAFLSTLRADQLLYITKTQAEQAVELLSKHSELLIWCACCATESETWSLVKIRKVYMSFPLDGRYSDENGDDYYVVIVEGIDHEGKKVKEELDLAYTHVRTLGGWTECVGQLIEADCSPCTPHFPWLLDAFKKKR